MTQPARCYHDGLVTEHYGVIIVGGGAGGGTPAHTRETGTRDPEPEFMANAIRAGEHLRGRMS